MVTLRSLVNSLPNIFVWRVRFPLLSRGRLALGVARGQCPAGGWRGAGVPSFSLVARVGRCCFSGSGSGDLGDDDAVEEFPEYAKT